MVVGSRKSCVLLLLTIPLRSLACTYWKVRTPQQGIAGTLELLRTFTSKSVSDTAQGISSIKLTNASQGSLGSGMQPGLSSLQMEIVNTLQLGERNKASSMLLEIGSKNHSATAKDFIHILQYCVQSKDPVLAMETWTIMGEKNVHVDDHCYLLIIKALCIGGYLDHAYNLLNMLGENKDVYPILPLYNTFLRGCINKRSPNHAELCLKMMDHQMVGKNKDTYAQFLKLAVWQKNLSAVYEIWKECSEYYRLGVPFLGRFVYAFAYLGDIEAAYRVLQYMVNLVSRDSLMINKTVDEVSITSVLDIPIPLRCELDLQLKENEVSICSDSVNSTEMKIDVNYKDQGSLFRAEGNGPGKTGFLGQRDPFIAEVLRSSFNNVIYSCGRTQNHTLAEQLFLQMKKLGLEPSSKAYHGLIRATISKGGFRDAIELLKAMKEQKIEPSDSTLAIISIGCSENLDLDAAEDFLHQISGSLRAPLFDTFFRACDLLDQPDRAVRVYKKMKEKNFLPSKWTYALLFSLLANVNEPYEEGNRSSRFIVGKRIEAIERDMVMTGVQHNDISMDFLLKALRTEGMLEELLQYIHMAEELYACGHPCLATPTYNTVLHALVKANETQKAVVTFRKMISLGFRPDLTTYGIMIDCCSTIRCYRSACALVSLMLRDGFTMNTVIYNTIIKTLLEDENLDEALHLVDQAKLDGVVLDVVTYNTILCKAKGNLDVIEALIEHMHRHKVQPDSITCMSVFTQYLHSGHIDTAMEALQVLCMRMISLEDSILQERKIQFEREYIFSEDLEAESSIIHLFKDYEDELAFALLCLRWRAILGYEISWLPDQSPWSRRLTNTYGPGEGAN